MPRKTLLLAAALSSITVLAGCGSPGHSRRVDETQSSIVEARGVHDDDFIIATRDLSNKISRRNAEGWPEHILMSSYGKPVVRVGKIVNRTRFHFQTIDLRNNIYNELVEQDVVTLVGQADDLSTVDDERDYSESGRTTGNLRYGDEDDVSLVLNGEITDEVLRQDGIEQRTYFFSLRLIDTVKNQIVLTTRRKIRKEREG